MCYIKKKIFIFFLMTNVICFGQDRKIELEIIGGKTYKNLFIRSRQLSKDPIKFVGETVNGTNWTFTIPDSIVKKTCNFDFKGQGQTETESFIGFISVIQGDTLIGNYINFENNELLIQLKVKYDHTAHEVNNQYVAALKKTVTIQQWDADYFSIDPIQNHYLRENMIDPTFGFKGYADVFSKIKENPNSLYYITRLATLTSLYKSKNDLSKLYYLFSNEMQHSFFGQMIYKNISTFEIANVSLTNCETKKEERIVTNPNKYTLLIFSISWCGPCHKKIPMLKRIYKEMNTALDMVYITIDDEKTLPQWNKLMRKENISWRSLLLNNKELKEEWNINAVPDYILISPDWKAQKVILNDENDINSLYSMIHNN